MAPVKYQTMQLSDLSPADYNPRKITEEALIGLENNLKEFGLVQNLVWNERTGNLVGGHQRMKALANQGEKEAMVAVVDLPLTREKALNVALNNPHISGTFDDGLSALLEEIQDDDAHLFEDIALDMLLEPDPEPTKSTQIPDVPEPKLKPKNPWESGERKIIGDHSVICGECIDVMRGMADESIDAIVTDPPYGIGFMGKEWDVAVPGIEWAKECLRVLKPGGHIIAFASTRTQHRLAVAIEDAGFEVRDTISWLYWQGFPKSLDVSKAIDKSAGVEFSSKPAGGVGFMNGDDDGYHPTLNQMERVGQTTDDAKQWDGFGTALKPSQEPAILARKPLIGTVAENVLKHGTGALNIDGCRIAFGDDSWPGPNSNEHLRGETLTTRRDASVHTVSLPATTMGFFDEKGRWPANIYVCPKPAQGEKESGLESLESLESRVGALRDSGRGKVARNFHPTVKPVRLMQWLIRLVTPPGGIVLDCFLGSGTTMVAAEREGVRSIGIEMSGEYCGIIQARVEHATGKKAKKV